MSNETYNGWTNYATWRVNLEIFDGMDIDDMGWRGMDRWALGETFEQYAKEVIEQTAPEGLARDYAMAFIDDVNWYEIADHHIEQDDEEAA